MLNNAAKLKYALTEGVQVRISLFVKILKQSQHIKLKSHFLKKFIIYFIWMKPNEQGLDTVDIDGVIHPNSSNLGLMSSICQA